MRLTPSESSRCIKPITATLDKYITNSRQTPKDGRELNNVISHYNRACIESVTKKLMEKYPDRVIAKSAVRAQPDLGQPPAQQTPIVQQPKSAAQQTPIPPDDYADMMADNTMNPLCDYGGATLLDMAYPEMEEDPEMTKIFQELELKMQAASNNAQTYTRHSSPPHQPQTIRKQDANQPQTIRTPALRARQQAALKSNTQNQQTHGAIPTLQIPDYESLM